MAQNIRLIFVPGTKALQQLLASKAGKGDTVHLIGIPRVNLNAVSSDVKASGGKQVTRKLPYEMIVVAVLE